MKHETKHTLLICTVGGSPDPLVRSLVHWTPERVEFIPSTETRGQIDTVLRSYAESIGRPLSPGCYDVHPLKDAESLARCLQAVRKFTDNVQNWVVRGADYQVAVDFTGGTKCMTAALALQAHRWPCRFSYVGGTRRNKEGVGIVESGTERVLHTANPWDALGYQAIEDACLLFDQNAFASASRSLQKALDAADDPARKRTLATLKQLCEAYDQWDRFQHKKAINELQNAEKNANDLSESLGQTRGAEVLSRLAEHKRHLEQIDAEHASLPLVHDLLANAQRRADEGRYDDAVARLYRAIEALAQLQLKEKHAIDTANVRLEELPEDLHNEWAVRAEDGKIKLGLQDAYRLLQALQDDLGDRFFNSPLGNPDKSPLTARNQSILAHGFRPVGEDIFKKLWKATIELAELDQVNQLAFPRLTEAGD